MATYNGFGFSGSDLGEDQGEVVPKLYWFELRDYIPAPSQAENPNFEMEEGESEDTARYRHQWHCKQVVFDHYQSQYENVKKEQHTLLERLSKGVGDIPTTMAYLTALRKADDDMKSLKDSVRPLKDEVGALRFNYLSSQCDDDREVLKTTSEELDLASKRIVRIDPDDRGSIRAEQERMIGLENKITDIQEAITDRDREMVGLAVCKENFQNAKGKDAEETEHDAGQRMDENGPRGSKKRKEGGRRGRPSRKTLGGDNRRSRATPQGPDEGPDEEDDSELENQDGDGKSNDGTDSSIQSSCAELTQRFHRPIGCAGKIYEDRRN